MTSFAKLHAKLWGVSITAAVALMLSASIANAQPRPPAGGAGRPGGGGATQSGPVQNRTVGPTSGGAGDDDDQGGPAPMRPEPQAQQPQDPLAIPKEIQGKIGTDDPGHLLQPVGDRERDFYGVYYAERRGDYRLRLAPPFYLDHTRGVGTQLKLPSGEMVSGEDQESLYGGLYYRRRSPKFDADALFPIAWKLRDDKSNIYALGPIIHRDAPDAHDNWVAPLFFEGKRPDGGYFHSPALLTTSHWNEKGAFTLVGPYFRNRTGSEVDMGVAPFYFHGDNPSDDGARKTYTLVPPLFYYRRDREADDNHLTVIGPVLFEENPKKEIFDVLPFYFSSRGRPESGGVRETSRTLFPFFSYAQSDERTRLILPGYYRKTTPTADTMITPFFAHATSRSGSTELTTAGPLVPMYWKYTDKDLAYSSFGIFPFWWSGAGPAGDAYFTPLFAKSETYGVSRTYWAFPNIVVQKDAKGWETDLHPLVYLGRTTESSHTVIAPIFWDFDNKKSRTTVGVPAFVRYADHTDDSVVQVAGNTLYMEKRVAGGKDWQFHVLPVFSYGENPSGYFWKVLFGLAGYTQEGPTSTVHALWIPFQTSGPPEKKSASRADGAPHR